METVTEQPIKKIEFFRCPQSLPGVAPLTKKPEDSGYEIVIILKSCANPNRRVEEKVVCHQFRKTYTATQTKTCTDNDCFKLQGSLN